MAPLIATERTITDMLLNRAAKTPNAIGMRSKRNGEWQGKTWAEIELLARKISYGLFSLGIAPADRVAILCQTREEWLLSDLGIVGSGASTVTIYPSNLPDQVAYILANSTSRLVIAEDATQLKKLRDERPNTPSVEKVILIDGEGDGDWVMTFKDLLARGEKLMAEQPDRFDLIQKQLTEKSIACIIYTSGTTGNPKGVMTPHEAFSWGGNTVVKGLPIDENDEQLLFLPLAHSFAKMLSIISIRFGMTTSFAESLTKAVDNMAEVRPTLMAAVPRIFEKVHQKVVSGAEEAGGLKLKIFRWAVSVGKQRSEYVLKHREEPGGILGLQYALATKLVFSKLHARFGGRLRFFISGGAPLSKDIAEFFHGAGVLILEGFGMTETNSITSVNRPESYKFGTIGKAFDGVEVKTAPDGELLIRGRMNMQGYWQMPEATAEALDSDGWLHTGDIAEIDSEGFIKITDRKKELIKTAGGKFVAPQRLENLMKTSMFISQVMVYGDTKPYCVALVTLDPEAVPNWAKAQGIAFNSTDELAKNPQVRQLIEREIAERNQKLASFETVKKFEILPGDFSVESGELTPSLKLKRKVVTKNYQALIDKMYAGLGD